MRKTITAILAFGLVGGLVAAPAAAGTKRKTYDYALAANPILTDVDPMGCAGDESVEGVHKKTVAFKAPRHRRTGTLSFRLGEFEGDYDLYVLKGAAVLASSTTDNLSQDYEAVSLRLRGGTKVSIVVCNWAGGPTAKGSLLYKYPG